MTLQNSSVGTPLRGIDPARESPRTHLLGTFAPSFLNVALLLALFVPFNLLYAPILFVVAHAAKNGAKGFTYLALGLAFTLYYLLVGTGDIRALLPFIVLFGLSNPSRSEKTVSSANQVFFIFVLLTIGVAALKVFGIGLLDRILSFYDDGAGEAFDYDIEDLGHFRIGSIYFNPNQWAFLACLFLIILRATGQLTMIKLGFILVITIATASRTMALILFVTLLYDQIRNWSLKKGLATAFVFALFLYYALSTESRLTTYDAGALLDQALFKFSLLGKLFAQDSLADLVFGIGVVGKGYYHFDADLGNVMMMYGLLGGSLLLIVYFIKLKESLPFFSILLLVLMSSYGTILTNTRIAIVFSILAIMCLSGKAAATAPGSSIRR